jgi:hypothetical protein
VTIDGEAVCCDDTGGAVFERLHSQAYDGEAFLYAVDLLELDGEDSGRSSSERRGLPSCSPRRPPGSSTASTSKATARPSLPSEDHSPADVEIPGVTEPLVPDTLKPNADERIRTEGRARERVEERAPPIRDRDDFTR